MEMESQSKLEDAKVNNTPNLLAIQYKLSKSLDYIVITTEKLRKQTQSKHH